MLKLIQIEFFKLRRRKLAWVMLLAAIVMPFLMLLFYKYFGKGSTEPILFYKWSAFSFTPFIILPFVLGVFCTMLMFHENQNDMTKQLWIIPINKMNYFFSKFFVMLIYSVFFMLITAFFSVLFSILSGYVAFSWGSILFLLEKCMEIGVLTSFAMLPIMAIAVSQKGYILPVCCTLVYIVLGFFLVSVNQYLHPISSASMILMRNGDFASFMNTQASDVPAALLCIAVWDIVSAAFAGFTLRRK